MSRSQKGAPFTLFAFQDAMTSVCGVVVLITLLLALQLTRAAVQDVHEIENAKKAQELNAEIGKLRERLAIAEAPDDLSKFAAEAASLSRSEIEARLNSARERLKDAERERDELLKELAEDESLKKKTNEIAAETESLERKLEKTKDAEDAERENLNEALKGGVLYNFPNDGALQPWFVDISGARVIALSRKSRKEFRDASDFIRWARTRPTNVEYFVLIARPSGAAVYSEINGELTAAGYQIGVDFIGETRELEFTRGEETERP